MKDELLLEFSRKMIELDGVIRRLDPVTRTAILDLFKLRVAEAPASRATASTARGPAGKAPRRGAGPNRAPLAMPIRQQPTPGDNVLLCASMLLSEHRGAKLTNQTLLARGHEIGVRLPKDPSRTLRIIRDRGRVLFRFEADGWKVTAAGAAYLRDQFGARLADTRKSPRRRVA